MRSRAGGSIRCLQATGSTRDMPAAGFVRQGAGAVRECPQASRAAVVGGPELVEGPRRRPAVQGDTSACPLCGDLRDLAGMNPMGLRSPHFNLTLFGPSNPTRAVTSPAWRIPLDRKWYPPAALPQRAGPGFAPTPPASDAGTICSRTSPRHASQLTISPDTGMGALAGAGSTDADARWAVQRVPRRADVNLPRRGPDLPRLPRGPLASAPARSDSKTPAAGPRSRCPRRGSAREQLRTGRPAIPRVGRTGRASEMVAVILAVEIGWLCRC